MMRGDIFVLISASLGVIYRAIYTEDINTLKRFIVSLWFSLTLGFIWVTYVDEESIRMSFAILGGVVIGLLSTNVASIILKIGKDSEGTIASKARGFIEQAIPGESNKKSDEDAK